MGEPQTLRLSTVAFDIIALGEPLYELNLQPDGRFLPGFGGDTSNAVIAAARLGARTAYVTRLGADMFGEAIMELWRAEAVDSSAVSFEADAPTGLYFVTHTAQGHVFTYRRAGSAASLMMPADLPESMIAEAKFLHASGISMAISASASATVTRAIAIARAAGARVSFDTNFRPKLWTAETAWPVIRAAAAEADILKTSEEDSRALFGISEPRGIARRFLDLGCKTVLVTLGSHGVLAATSQSYDIVPGFPVAAIDATGAGDAFTGALLCELARGQTLHDAVRFANAAAALSTLGYGAIAPLPRRTAVEAFMRTQS